MSRNTEDMPQLTERDNNPRSGNESGHNRVGEQVRQKTEAQETHSEQHQAGYHGHSHGRCGVVDGAHRGDFAYSGGSH